MNKKLCLVQSILVLALTWISPSYSRCSTGIPRSHAGFSGMFVFGNSLFDSGNNNFLKCAFKANYSPYGIDFPSHPPSNGRFTNGKNQADRIGELLGLPLVPTFSDPETKKIKISRGVNHASAGSGILDSTGSNLGVVGLNQQIRDFVAVTLPMLKDHRGCQDTAILEKDLFLITTGNNDFLINFFKRGSNVGMLQYFSHNLTSSLAIQLTRLYNAGARKFAFVGIGPMGCTPMARATVPNKACNKRLNYAADYFNAQLLVMLNTIKPRLPGFQFVMVNIFKIALESIRNPSSAGFKDVSNSCCTLASDGVRCKQRGNVCTKRSSHLFFDGLHPTEAFYSIVATRAYKSTNRTEVFPYNLQKLGQL
ncbi:GDSL esterase/lipase At5g08460-like [Silene latifolia]|uniref:GDSL esterase/lipase At5g08460-like n=1 Tax=Silene latifolia TaxID=37657 RepID=UPI003D786443